MEDAARIDRSRCRGPWSAVFSFAAGLLGIVCFVGTGSLHAAPQRDHPNVLIILTDDQGWGDLSLHGNRTLETPVIDGLARSGMRLDRFFVCPDGAPTRASLLTGRYHYRSGVTGTVGGEEVLQDYEVTLAEVLDANGYVTGLFGRWANGRNWPFHPRAQGFDHFTGLCAQTFPRYFDVELERDGTVFESEGYLTEVLTDEALAFMEANRERSFLCWVSYPAPHVPYQAPKPLFDKYRERGLEPETAAVYAMLESVDSQVGRLLDWLRETGLEEDTIVFFTSDNGPALERHGAPKRDNGRLYGEKGSVHQGGVRVPCVFRYPGVIPPGTRSDEICAHIDLLPTLIHLTDVVEVETLAIDGLSLDELLRGGGKVDRWPNRILFTSWTPGYRLKEASVAVRTGRWLAVKDPRWRRDGGEGEVPWELYDMRADPYQLYDVAEDYWYLAGHLSADYSFWMKETTEHGVDPIPIEVGHAEWPRVSLRAQDADASEGWARERGAGSWLAGWRSISDEARWSLRVVEAGRHEVWIEHAVSESARGSTLRLDVGHTTLSHQFDQVVEAEATGGPDLAPRPGVSPRRGAWVRIGEVELEAGDGDLVLGPASPDGRAFPEVAGIELRAIGP